MKCVMLLIVLAAASSTAARAEPRMPPPAPAAAPEIKPPPAAAPAVDAARLIAKPMFAPASVALARPMAPQERQERQFLRDAAAASRFESDASRLVLARSANREVRSYATALLKHHETARNELQYLLQARGMAAPMLANHQRKTLNRLAKAQGAKLDREFLARVGLESQREVLLVYERTARSAQDPQVKAWIERNLPALREHMASGSRLASPRVRVASRTPETSARTQATPASFKPGPARRPNAASTL